MLLLLVLFCLKELDCRINVSDKQLFNCGVSAFVRRAHVSMQESFLLMLALVVLLC